MFSRLRPHGIPGDHFVRTLKLTRSLADMNKDLLLTNFMNLDMYERWINMPDLTLFHLDPLFMSGSQSCHVWAGVFGARLCLLVSVVEIEC